MIVLLFVLNSRRLAAVEWQGVSIVIDTSYSHLDLDVVIVRTTVAETVAEIRCTRNSKTMCNILRSESRALYRCSRTSAIFIQFIALTHVSTVTMAPGRCRWFMALLLTTTTVRHLQLVKLRTRHFHACFAALNALNIETLTPEDMLLQWRHGLLTRVDKV